MTTANASERPIPGVDRTDLAWYCGGGPWLARTEDAGPVEKEGNQ
jgi:hypothetical protein